MQEIHVISGNIFTTKLQTIVNTVNCFGIMGAGLALECRYRYPDLFTRYKEMCDSKMLDVGKLFLYKTNVKWILNFPTKKHWKFPSKPEYIELGLKKLVSTYRTKGIESIAFPLLGAHNGGLSKEHSLEILSKYVEHLQIPFEVYEYNPTSPDDIFDKFVKAFLSTDEKLLVTVTGLKQAKTRELKEILKSNEVHNMSQLISLDGIGESTAEKCFQFAMQSESLNPQLSIF